MQKIKGIEEEIVSRTLNIWMKGCRVQIAMAFTTAPLKKDRTEWTV